MLNDVTIIKKTTTGCRSKVKVQRRKKWERGEQGSSIYKGCVLSSDPSCNIIFLYIGWTERVDICSVYTTSLVLLYTRI